VRPRDTITLIIVASVVAGSFLLPRVQASPRADASLVGDAEGCRASGDVPTRSNLASTRAAILCLLNRERARHGLLPLQRSAMLEFASQRHSDDMAARDFYAHQSPEGVEPSDRTDASGYPSMGVVIGENIHWGVEANATPVRIVEDWMESPGHRENILRPSFTEVGVGVAHDAPQRDVQGRAGVYTTDFGGPLGP
jgi:uncharacterized protein YkwD